MNGNMQKINLNNGFTHPLSESIKIRQSWRTYLSTGMSNAQKQEIIEFIKNLPRTPFSQFGSQTRFEILDMNEIDPSQAKQLGTYGFIKGTRQFLVGCFTPADYALENYAYLFELIVLKATEMGLGTCWLAGSFNKSGFAAAFVKNTEEHIPAVSPLGQIPKHRRLKEQMLRKAFKAKTRFPWSKLFFEGDFSTELTEEKAGPYKSILEMVRIGPSAANRQPWRIVKDVQNHAFHFYVYDPHESHPGWTQFRSLDLGIACAHFDLMCQELGFKGQWCFEKPQLTTPPDVVYRFSWIFN